MEFRLHIHMNRKRYVYDRTQCHNRGPENINNRYIYIYIYRMRCGRTDLRASVAEFFLGGYVKM